MPIHDWPQYNDIHSQAHRRWHTILDDFPTTTLPTAPPLRTTLADDEPPPKHARLHRSSTSSSTTASSTSDTGRPNYKPLPALDLFQPLLARTDYGVTPHMRHTFVGCRIDHLYAVNKIIELIIADVSHSMIPAALQQFEGIDHGTVNASPFGPNQTSELLTHYRVGLVHNIVTGALNHLPKVMTDPSQRLLHLLSKAPVALYIYRMAQAAATKAILSAFAPRLPTTDGRAFTTLSISTDILNYDSALTTLTTTADVINNMLNARHIQGGHWLSLEDLMAAVSTEANAIHNHIAWDDNISKTDIDWPNIYMVTPILRPAYMDLHPPLRDYPHCLSINTIIDKPAYLQARRAEQAPYIGIHTPLAPSMHTPAIMSTNICIRARANGKHQNASRFTHGSHTRDGVARILILDDTTNTRNEPRCSRPCCFTQPQQDTPPTSTPQTILPTTPQQSCSSTDSAPDIETHSTGSSTSTTSTRSPTKKIKYSCLLSTYRQSHMEPIAVPCPPPNMCIGANKDGTLETLDVYLWYKGLTPYICGQYHCTLHGLPLFLLPRTGHEHEQQLDGCTDCLTQFTQPFHEPAPESHELLPHQLPDSYLEPQPALPTGTLEPTTPRSPMSDDDPSQSA